MTSNLQPMVFAMDFGRNLPEIKLLTIDWNLFLRFLRTNGNPNFYKEFFDIYENYYNKNGGNMCGYSEVIEKTLCTDSIKKIKEYLDSRGSEKEETYGEYIEQYLAKNPIIQHELLFDF